MTLPTTEVTREAGAPGSRSWRQKAIKPGGWKLPESPLDFELDGCPWSWPSGPFSVPDSRRHVLSAQWLLPCASLPPPSALGPEALASSLPTPRLPRGSLLWQSPTPPRRAASGSLATPLLLPVTPSSQCPLSGQSLPLPGSPSLTSPLFCFSNNLTEPSFTHHTVHPLKACKPVIVSAVVSAASTTTRSRTFSSPPRETLSAIAPEPLLHLPSPRQPPSRCPPLRVCPLRTLHGPGVTRHVAFCEWPQLLPLSITSSRSIPVVRWTRALSLRGVEEFSPVWAHCLRFICPSAGRRAVVPAFPL